MFFQSYYRIRLLISLMMSFTIVNSASASDLNDGAINGIIDDRRSGDFRSNTGVEWRLISDNVMGGLSTGQLILDKHKGKECLRMRGDVTTENNGGFLQIALSLSDIAQPGSDVFDASAYSGVELEVSGNDENYNIHFRTGGLWFPWQSYRASFTAVDSWQTIRIPFASLQPYKTIQTFSPKELIRIGLVAIGRKFQADLCLASVKFYSE